jgi:hypothetical protein
MTRLKSYINEVGILGIDDTDIPKAAEIIKKDCGKFIKEIQGYGFPYRGFVSMESAKQVLPNSSLLYEHSVRKNRRPRYVTGKTHGFLSDLSKKYFGWDIRQEGVFTGSKNTAKGYGNLRAVLPIGNYEYVAFTKDLLTLYKMYDRPVMYPQDFGSKEDYDAYFEDLKKVVLKGYKKNKGLRGAVQNQGAAWEIIFKCDKYYSISLVRSSVVLDALY